MLPAILLAGLYINTNVFADSNDVDFSITVNPSLTLALSSKLDLNTVPGTYSTTINFQMTANFVPITLEDAYAGAGKSKVTIENEEYYAMLNMTFVHLAGEC